MKPTRFVVITPVRDEEKYIEHTLLAMVAQTVTPLRWVIVDDGSTDRTAEIVEEYQKKYRWIEKVRRADRGCRKPGGGVIEAFYEGYASVQLQEWDFIVKLDADLSFEPRYFESCFERFRDNPRLGMAGGMIYHDVGGIPQLEKQPLFHVRGATKIYRRECWEGIGGLIAAPGWDALDEVKANMLGFETRSFEELKVLHHRRTGTSVSRWANGVKDGRADYVVGYHPLFMFLKCCTRIARRPYLVGACGLFWGYLSGYLKKIPQVDDKAVIAFLREQQMRRLLFKTTMWR